MSAEQPTIFALATAPGKSGIAVARVSGSRVRAVLEAMTGSCPEPRRAVLCRIAHPSTGELIDSGLVLYFPGPASFTGEDVAEFHLHGGRAVIKAVLAAIGSVPECRMAEPGEFSRRAFLNGKLDLTSAEGLADLIDAETETQRRQALLQSSGALSALYEDWRRRLIEACALVEAGIDFSDEADVSRWVFDQAAGAVRDLSKSIASHLDDGRRGEIIRDGFRAVLAGAPNAGKSSLLNALARRDAAIVSEEAGTTRDVIEVHLDISGIPVILADTAGIREARGAIEREGIRRSLERAKTADLLIWLVDAAEPKWDIPAEFISATVPAIRVVNKLDLAGEQFRAGLEPDVFALSAKTGEGLEALTGILGQRASERIGGVEGPAITQIRHRQLIEVCSGHLACFLTEDCTQTELRAEDLRLAASALGRITGRIDAEDVLGLIFGRFCIGK